MILVLKPESFSKSILKSVGKTASRMIVAWWELDELLKKVEFLYPMHFFEAVLTSLSRLSLILLRFSARRSFLSPSLLFLLSAKRLKHTKVTTKNLTVIAQTGQKH